jgi:hypothetical protein
MAKLHLAQLNYVLQGFEVPIALKVMIMQELQEGMLARKSARGHANRRNHRTKSAKVVLARRLTAKFDKWSHAIDRLISVAHPLYKSRNARSAQFTDVRLV